MQYGAPPGYPSVKVEGGMSRMVPTGQMNGSRPSSTLGPSHEEPPGKRRCVVVSDKQVRPQPCPLPPHHQFGSPVAQEVVASIKPAGRVRAELSIHRCVGTFRAAFHQCIPHARQRTLSPEARLLWMHANTSLC